MTRKERQHVPPIPFWPSPPAVNPNAIFDVACGLAIRSRLSERSVSGFG